MKLWEFKFEGSTRFGFRSVNWFKSSMFGSISKKENKGLKLCELDMKLDMAGNQMGVLIIDMLLLYGESR